MSLDGVSVEIEYSIINGVVDTDGSIDAGMGDISITTDSLSIFSNSITTGTTTTPIIEPIDPLTRISTQGDLTIQPRDPARGIALAPTNAGLDRLELDRAIFDLVLVDGFNSITIGRADGSHPVEVRSVTFSDPVVLRAPNGGSITLTGPVIFSDPLDPLDPLTLTLDTGGLGDITAVNPLNDFVTINSNAYNLTLVEANSLQLGTSIINGDLNLAVSGDIASAGDMTVSGNADLVAGGQISIDGPVSMGGDGRFNAAGSIAMTHPGNDFVGAISLNNSGNNDVAITDSNLLTFGASNLGIGVFDVLANGITQTGPITQEANAGATTFDAGAGPLVLDLANDFTGPMNLVNTGNNDVRINDINRIDFGSLGVGIGSLTVSAPDGISVGSFIQEPNAGLATFSTDQGPIDLSGPGNGFTGPVALFTLGAGAVTLFNSGGVVLASSNLGTGVLSVTGSGISQTGPVVAAGLATFDAGAGPVALDLANDFTGLVDITNSGNNEVLVHDINTLEVGFLNLGSGSLTVSAPGGISIGSFIQEPNAGLATFSTDQGPIDLSGPGNNAFTGPVALFTLGAGAVTLFNSGEVVLASSSLGTGALSVTGSGISQTSPVVAAGPALFDAGMGPITLDLENDFMSAISLVNNGNYDVVVSDVNQLTIDTTNLGSGAFSVLANGIAQTGPITQEANAGATSFDAGAGPVDLGLANDFTGLVNLVNTGNNDVRINDINRIDFGSLGVGSGSLTVSAPDGISAGAIIQEPSLAIATFSTDQGPIDLSGPGNAFTGPVALFTLGAGAVTLFNSSEVVLASSSLGTGALSVTGSGISQTGPVMVAGPAVFDAGMGPIILTDPNNRFSDHVSLSSIGFSDVQITTAYPLLLDASALGSGQSIFQASDLNMMGLLTGASGIILQPFSADQAIGLGDGTGSFILSNADIAYLADGFASIQIGASGATGQVTIENARFTDPLVIQADGPGAGILINASLFGADNANITLNGSGATTQLNGDIITQGNNITINDAVLLTTDALLDTTAGGSFTGGDITLNGPLTGSNRLTVRGGFLRNRVDAPLSVGGLSVIPTGNPGNGARVFGEVQGMGDRLAAQFVEVAGGGINPEFTINGCVMGISCQGFEERTYVDVPLNTEIPVLAKIELISVWFKRKTMEDPRDSRYSNLGNEELWRVKQESKASEDQ